MFVDFFFFFKSFFFFFFSFLFFFFFILPPLLLPLPDSILETGGKANVLNFADKIHKWMGEGWKGLGDESGAGMGKTTGAVLKHSSFKEVFFFFFFFF